MSIWIKSEVVLTDSKYQAKHHKYFSNKPIRDYFFSIHIKVKHTVRIIYKSIQFNHNYQFFSTKSVFQSHFLQQFYAPFDRVLEASAEEIK